MLSKLVLLNVEPNRNMITRGLRPGNCIGSINVYRGPRARLCLGSINAAYPNAMPNCQLAIFMDCTSLAY
ncbi:hypothetical protein SLE2022_203610 [Rubroshorea leprosula]